MIDPAHRDSLGYACIAFFALLVFAAVVWKGARD